MRSVGCFSKLVVVLFGSFTFSFADILVHKVKVGKLFHLDYITTINRVVHFIITYKRYFSKKLKKRIIIQEACANSITAKPNGVIMDRLLMICP